MPILRIRKSGDRRDDAPAFSWKACASACACCALLAFFISAGPLLTTLHAQAEQGKSNSAPNYGLEGDWVRIDVIGAGDFGGLNKDVPKAQLTPVGQALLAKVNARTAAYLHLRNKIENAPHKPGVPYVVITTPCEGRPGYVNESNGMGTFDPNSAAFHMIISQTQVVWTGEGADPARIIWMSGRELPNESGWAEPQPISVGHWENGVLVVKTVGLPTGGGVAGQGVREPSTVLTEQFELMPGGKQMKIVYTYWDPKLYTKPQTYAYTFDQALPAYALEGYCDPSDPLEYQSIVPQSQNPK